jgi:RHH-type rel operon transcriptional repressor/antitoxin RelB
MKRRQSETVCFSVASETISALATLSRCTRRSREYLLNEAITNYLDLQQWHLEQIKAGIDEARAGKVIEHRKLRMIASKWRRR